VRQERTASVRLAHLPVVPPTLSSPLYIVLYKGTNYALTDPPTPTLFQYSGSITHLMLQNEIPLPSTLSHLHLAHASGVQTIFNPSPLPSVPELLGFPWSELDWLILNESEASDLLSALGESYEAAPAPPTLPRPDGAASMFGAYAVTARLHAHSGFSRTTNIICTLGSIGVLALVPTLALPVYVPAITLPSGALDTTGAGDCFAGYFVAGLMRLHDEGKALDTPALERILARCVQVRTFHPTNATRHVLTGRPLRPLGCAANAVARWRASRCWRRWRLVSPRSPCGGGGANSTLAIIERNAVSGSSRLIALRAPNELPGG
jgi:sugar/nucleoside kinase (ribokinase family)